MKLINEEANGVFTVPKRIEKYLGSAKKSELKLIFYIFSHQSEPFSVADASKALSETVESINSALSFWRGTGIIVVDDDEESEAVKTSVTEKKPQETEKNSYTLEEVTEAMSKDKDFKQLVDFTQKTTGDLLNSSKQSELLYLYDNLGMQCDVLMGIIAYCASIGKNKLSYIVSTAKGIHKDGITSYKELDVYFAAKKSYAQYESMVKRVIGAGNRALTLPEKNLVSIWEKEYKSSEELVGLAYEKTINSISKPSIQYMSTILEGWKKDGLTTAESVKKKLAEKKNDGQKDKPTGGFDFDLNDIFEKP